MFCAAINEQTCSVLLCIRTRTGTVVLGRMENITWANRVKNEEVLCRVRKEKEHPVYNVIKEG